VTADPPAPKMVARPVVLLRRPPDAPDLPEDRLDELQQRHLEHLAAMGAAGDLLVAGPCDDQEDESLRGICLFREGLSLDEVRRMASDDPSVQAGRLVLEVFTWWTFDGALAFPPAPSAVRS
jgi:uncharacterized protein YciI